MINNEEIEKYRQELRNERNVSREQSSEASTNLKRYSETSDRTLGPSVQTTRRESTTFRPISAETGNGDQGESYSQRSVEAKPVRERPSRRRFGSPKPRDADSTETNGNSSGTTIAGGIERVDEPFYRPDPEEKKPEKKAEGLVKKLVEKLPDSGDGVPFFGTPRGKTFSKKEAEDQFEAVKQAISDYGDYIDLYMQKIEPGLPPIWSNFAEKELEFVAKALLKRSQTDQRAAIFTRTLLDGQDYIGALVALVPRFVETLKFANRRIPRRRIQKGPARENTN